MAHLGFMLTRSLSAGSGSRSFQLLAEAAVKKHFVSVFFVNDGVYQCLQNDTQSIYGSNLGDFLDKLAEAGASILVSHPCLESRGLKMESVHSGAKIVTMEFIAEAVGKADKVVCL